MQNVKLFPSFQLPDTASATEKSFLESLKKARLDSGAAYVNFSAYPPEEDEAKPIHIITYPMEWVTHYIQNNYQEIDPLFQLDYRRVAALDWRDIRRTPETHRFFEDFEARGLGNQGVALTDQLMSGTFGITHFCYRVEAEGWDAFRSQKIETLRQLAHHLASAYGEAFEGAAPNPHPLTRRERQCLYWVAMGKTDEEIGELLAIGKWTVVSHLKSAKHKLNCANRASAVAKAIADGIVVLGSGES